MKKKNQKGIVSLITIFLLGTISLLIGMSLLKTGLESSVREKTQAKSLKAFYAANSGIEEAIRKIQQPISFGYPNTETFSINIYGINAEVKVYGTENLRTIESVGIYNNHIKKIKAVIQNTELKPGFGNAILAGFGGVVLRNNTLITSKDGSGGNVYSNTFVKGAKNDFTVSSGVCKISASKVDGSVFAVQKINKLSNSDSGVCIFKEAHAGSLDYCFVGMGAFSPISPSAACPVKGTWTNEPAPSEVSLPELGISAMKNYLLSKTIFEGDCLANGSGGPSDCTFGTNTLGNITINGNLVKPSGTTLLISGPVWVKGNIVFNSNGTIGLIPGINKVSQIILADGTITSDSNNTYLSNGTAFLLFVSTFDPGVGIANVCNDGVNSAINISSNSNSVLFYSVNGCIQVNANSLFHGAILGQGIRVENNSTVEYDPALQTAIFGITQEGGWQTVSFGEY